MKSITRKKHCSINTITELIKYSIQNLRKLNNGIFEQILLIEDKKLFRISGLDFHTRHLLIITVLTISFSISALLRSLPASYGFHLNEYDPFFNFRATQYLLDHGLNAYIHWHDNLSWYPYGRDVFVTSQAMLHITAAFLYKVFGAGLSLYDFTIIFPVVFGSLTTIIVFVLVRVMGGTTAGLFASLFFAVAPPIISRGTIGWFKSEPLGLFFGLLSLYLVLSGLQSRNHKIGLVKTAGGGLLLSFGLSSWGGNEFFIIPLGIFFVVLPLLRNDYKFLATVIPIFVAVTLSSSLLFERPGIHFVGGLGGLSLIGSTLILLSLCVMRRFNKKNTIRNYLIVFVCWAIAGLGVFTSKLVILPYSRYLAAINPFFESNNDLVSSTVIEHHLQSTADIFSSSSILLLLSGFGAWLILDRIRSKTTIIDMKKEMMFFMLILGIIGAYVGTNFLRLGLFTSLGLIPLASIGLAVIASKILKKDQVKIIKTESAEKSKTKTIKIVSYKPNKIAFVLGIVLILLIPLFSPLDNNWVLIHKIPPTLLTGNTRLNISTNDWPMALDWIKNNTPKDAVIVSWWDYGYFIETLGERRTVADGATFSYPSISQTAKMFLSPPNEGWKILHDMKANYVVVFLSGEKFTLDGQQFYMLGGGGDESKIRSIAKIAGFNLTDFFDNEINLKDSFSQNTLLGNLMPFISYKTHKFTSNVQSESDFLGYRIYIKQTNLQTSDNAPLKLVYSSPGLDSQTDGPFLTVLVYEVNYNYKLTTNS